MSQLTYLSRDPFARNWLVRRQVPADKMGCAWCGNLNRYGKLFQYGFEEDKVHTREPTWEPMKFCSIGCRRAYYL